MGLYNGGPGLLNQLHYGLGSPPVDGQFDVSPKHRAFATSGLVAVPLSGSATLTAFTPIPDTFNEKDGLSIDALMGNLTANDTTGHLQVVDAAVQLKTNLAQLPIIPLGTPQPTTLFPRFELSFAFTLPPLFSLQDLIQWGVAAGLGPGIPNFLNTQPWRIVFTVSLANNDGAAAHSATLNLWTAYRRVYGLSGA